MCVNYRKLNAVTVTDSYPMSRIDDLHNSAKKPGCMKSWDLLINCKLALKNAPATFYRLMDDEDRLGITQRTRLFIRLTGIITGLYGTFRRPEGSFPQIKVKAIRDP
ncbi:uncharacterized protein LOC105663893 isoform X2 [Megachile rotundata]|uniref:uncharacterized protein LOC105663893 isoform X2 n=1 Tax=Megachile rotundata TaxID=143995 RepID=UPI003FD5C298